MRKIKYKRRAKGGLNAFVCRFYRRSGVPQSGGAVGQDVGRRGGGPGGGGNVRRVAQGETRMYAFSSGGPPVVPVE